MATISLAATTRDVFGKKVKKLRKQDLLPANIYGKKIKSQAIQLATQDFTKIFKQAGETAIIQLSLKGENQPRAVLVANLQKDPVTDQPLHADFHQVDLKEKVTVAIPVEIRGESLAVKEKGAVLITLLDEIKVEALPTDLPEKFEVDISGLSEFDDSILVKTLKIDKSKVTILANEEEAIVMVQEPKKEEEPVEPEEEEKPEGEAEEFEASEEEPKEKEKGAEEKEEGKKIQNKSGTN